MALTAQQKLNQLISEELDSYARGEGHESFATKLNQVIAAVVIDKIEAVTWTTATIENVHHYLSALFSLKVTGREVVVTCKPKISASEALRRLQRPWDSLWERAWIEMPHDAFLALRMAAAQNGAQIKHTLVAQKDEIAIPDPAEIAPLLENAIKIAAATVRNDKYERDYMLGSMLRMYWSSPLEEKSHVGAWVFIISIEDCYSPLVGHKPFSGLKRRRKAGIFDIPERPETRRDLHSRYVEWRTSPALRRGWIAIKER